MSEVVEKIKNCIKDIDEKTFKLFFFVVDSKGTPLGSLAYIYETAKELKDAGYNVNMLHAEKEFEGVGSWMGEEYASLPHFYSDTKSVTVTPADFLFIPEIYSSVMTATKELPCKRVAILQNFGYLTDTIPMGVSWENLKIRDCITTTNALKEKITEVFPEVKVRVIKPKIQPFFSYDTNEPKKLIVNVVSKNQGTINSMIKPFFWKYPQYRWVAFRNIAGLPRQEFAKALAEGFATIWCDPTTDFGYSALEAMACGNIVIGKIPENIPEWMGEDGMGIKNNGVWFYNDFDSQEAIASVIQAFITNTIPAQNYEEMSRTVQPYRDVERVAEYEKMFAERKNELETFLKIYEEKEKETTSNE